MIVSRSTSEYTFFFFLSLLILNLMLSLTMNWRCSMCVRTIYRQIREQIFLFEMIARVQQLSIWFQPHLASLSSMSLLLLLFLPCSPYSLCYSINIIRSLPKWWITFHTLSPDWRKLLSPIFRSNPPSWNSYSILHWNTLRAYVYRDFVLFLLPFFGRLGKVSVLVSLRFYHHRFLFLRFSYHASGGNEHGRIFPNLYGKMACLPPLPYTHTQQHIFGP